MKTERKGRNNKAQNDKRRGDHKPIEDRRGTRVRPEAATGRPQGNTGNPNTRRDLLNILDPIIMYLQREEKKKKGKEEVKKNERVVSPTPMAESGRGWYGGADALCHKINIMALAWLNAEC